jgi:hypothetical protein
MKFFKFCNAKIVYAFEIKNCKDALTGFSTSACMSAFNNP